MHRLFFALAATLASAASAQTLNSTLFANTLRRPVFFTHAPFDATRQFVLEKQGFIRIIKNGVLQSTASPFLNIDSLVGGGTSTGDERGLLGLAFHPDYAFNRKFYVYYIDNSANSIVAEYLRSPTNPDAAVASSARILMSFPRTATNHQGGWIAFGKDGLLYIASGDSGSSCDPDNAAQNVNDRRGKLLRIDIERDDFPADATRNYGIPASNPFAISGGAPEVLVMGLRNPWRNSFDRETGDLFIADVGQGQREEVNFVEAGSVLSPVRNFGWDYKEGDVVGTCSGTTSISTGVLVDPVHVYDHNTGCSISGGYVYRGCAIPALQGTYFFGDYCSAAIWSFRYTTLTGKTEFADRSSELGGRNVRISNIVSFGEDFFGEMYVVEQGTTSTNGEIWKIVPATGPLSCTPCPADLNGDRAIDDADFVFFARSYDILECSDQTMPPSCRADINADTVVDDADFSLFAGAYDAFACN